MPKRDTLSRVEFAYGDAGRLDLGGGIAIYREIHGAAGPGLTIVNNFFMVSPTWRTFTSKLQQKTRVVTYDLRNQGGSSRTSTEPSWDDHLSDLGAVIEGSGLTDTYLMGTSLSAAMCRDYALRNPTVVKGLILVGPAFGPNGMTRQRYLAKSWLATLDNFGMSALFDHIYPQVFGDDLIESIGTAGYEMLRESFTTLHSPGEIRASITVSLQVDPDPALLGKLSMPTLVMVGDNDFLNGADGAHAMADRIPQAHTAILRGSGHLPFLEVTEDFENALWAFINNCEEKSGVDKDKGEAIYDR